MIKKQINQNDTLKLEFIKTLKNEFEFSKSPINRVKKIDSIAEEKFLDKNKVKNLSDLKEKINSIEDCNLKRNATQIVFGDGNLESKIMIVGEGPGQKEDQIGKSFVGDAGELLNKMLNAINLKRENIYITNVVNFRPPNDRKPEPSEINRYSYFLKEHIAIIDPEILVLMGSTAMEAIFGSKIKISQERGSWKETIIKNKTYISMITFHPAYLIRQADKKKYSWIDLKKIRKKIDELKLTF